MLTGNKNQVHEFLSNKSSLILFLILVGIGVLILFSRQRKERDIVNINTPRTNHSTSSGQLSYHHDEFNELMLKPNRTYTIRFLQAGTSGTFYAPAMSNVRIKSPIHHTTIFPDTSFGESGNRGWLGNKKAYERFKIFSADIQDITITTSG